MASSYWQTIHAYPSGGGAYIVAKDNLGTLPGLVAGSAILVDYVLTVSVSTASGVAAITSAFPALLPHRVVLCVACVLAVMLANLRGLRETGRTFAVPTYGFILALTVLIVGGFYQFFTQGAPPPPTDLPMVEPLSIFLVLRAFSGGCAALTGIEAVATGYRPSSRPSPATQASRLPGWPSSWAARSWR